MMMFPDIELKGRIETKRFKYSSCTAPVGFFCSKHGVTHKEEATGMKEEPSLRMLRRREAAGLSKKK